MVKFMDHHNKSSKLDAVGWSLFFIWVGVAWIANLGFGIGLIGVAMITLGMQLVRKLAGLPLEIFWIVVGIGFGIGGLWNYFEIQTPLAPIVLIIAGLVLLVSVVRFGHKDSVHHSSRQDQ